MKKSIIIAVCVGLAVGIGGFIWLTHNSSLNSDLYPLYTGATWGPIEASEVNGAAGYKVVSNKVNVADLDTTSTKFESYYQSKLTKAGWTPVIVRRASNPGSELSVYTKGNEVIVVSLKTDFNSKAADGTPACPCDMQFSLISATTK